MLTSFFFFHVLRYKKVDCVSNFFNFQFLYILIHNIALAIHLDFILSYSINLTVKSILIILSNIF